MDSVKEKFWDRVDMSDPDGCWEWQSGFCGKYGSFYHEGERQPAHRVSFELTNGPIKTGLKILHSCDNPRCCNPAHLSQGTQQKNISDAFKRGRLYANKISKLDKGKAQFIRVLCLELNFSHRKAGALFGVNHRTVGRIVTGQYWAEA